MSEATIDITIASKTNEVQWWFVKQCAYVQTLGNGKREGKIKQFQNEECASLVWKQNEIGKQTQNSPQGSTITRY